jgi:hypothetical protein
MQNTPFPLGRQFIPDERDKNFPLRAAMPKKALPWRDKKWWTGNVLSQSAYTCPEFTKKIHPHDPYCGEYGFCTEFMARSWLKASPIRTGLPYPELQIYHESQKIDQWRGEEYAGTSVRAVFEWLRHKGHVAQYLWSHNAVDAANFVRTQGTLGAGTNWTQGMFFPDASTGYLLDCTGPVAGGHAYHITWYYKVKNIAGRTLREVFEIKNSWGDDWGNGGYAYMRASDLDRLLDADGELCAAFEKKVIK